MNINNNTLYFIINLKHYNQKWQKTKISSSFRLS